MTSEDKTAHGDCSRLHKRPGRHAEQMNAQPFSPTALRTFRHVTSWGQRGAVACSCFSAFFKCRHNVGYCLMIKRQNKDTRCGFCFVFCPSETVSLHRTFLNWPTSLDRLMRRESVCVYFFTKMECVVYFVVYIRGVLNVYYTFLYMLNVYSSCSMFYYAY